jgi:hypothetical protein
MDPILTLLDSERPSGVLQLLEKAASAKRQSSDKSVVTNITKMLKLNDLIKKSEDDDLSFEIKHTSAT